MKTFTAEQLENTFLAGVEELAVQTKTCEVRRLLNTLAIPERAPSYMNRSERVAWANGVVAGVEAAIEILGGVQ